MKLRVNQPARRFFFVCKGLLLYVNHVQDEDNDMPYGTRGQVRRSRSRAGVFNFGDELRAWRHKHNLSQSEAAQVSKRTLQEREQGRAEPEGLARIAFQNIVR